MKTTNLFYASLLIFASTLFTSVLACLEFGVSWNNSFSPFTAFLSYFLGANAIYSLVLCIFFFRKFKKEKLLEGSSKNLEE